MMEVGNCRKTFPDCYIRVMAFNSERGVESPAMSFIVNRPAKEPGFALERTEVRGRQLQYTTRAYAADRPSGERYG
jgi:ribulose-bisphosphate carboxylase small chain